MFTDIEFWKVAWLSPTFKESMFYAGLLLSVFLLLIFTSFRYFLKFKDKTFGGLLLSFKQDKRGSANAVDFVLVIPFFMFMMCLFVQMSMVVNASLIVHYAAYSAARSASVHFCKRSVLAYPLGYFGGCSVSKAEGPALNAARYVLIAASPVDASIPSSGNPPSQNLQHIADSYLDRRSPLMTQARYAFDSRNVSVDVQAAVSSDPSIQAQFWLERIPQLGSTDPNTLTDRKLLNSWPVTVKVEFIKHLGVPLVGPFLSDVRRGNIHFRRIEAEITLL